MFQDEIGNRNILPREARGGSKHKGTVTKKKCSIVDGKRLIEAAGNTCGGGNGNGYDGKLSRKTARGRFKGFRW